MAKELPAKRKLHFEPGNVDITVTSGANLLETAIQAGEHIYASCGGAGTCGTCKVQIEKGEVEASQTAKISDEEFDQGIRQACQSRVDTDLSVSVLPESRLEIAVLTQDRKVTSGVAATGWRFKPPLGKYCVELSPPDIEDNVSDLSRLLRGLKKSYQLRNITVDFDVLRKLPQVLRNGDWQVTVSALVTAVESRAADKRRPRLINVETGDVRKKHYALAFDIGTTTVVGQLLDLNRGKVVAEGIAYNGQISHGADVITRITACQKPGGLGKLQKAVVTTINTVIKQYCPRVKLSRSMSVT